MKLAGEYRFDAPVPDVWDALFDPEVLAAALPGCEKLERAGDQLVGAIQIKVGPVSGSFAGKVDLQDVDAPKTYTMIIDGRGNAGFVKATAHIALAPDGDATTMRYDADAQVGGKIASVGQRLVDASSRAVVKQSLEGLHENVKRRHAARVATEAAAAAAATAADAAAAASADGATELPPASPAPLVAKPALVHVQTADVAAAVTREVGKVLWPWILAGLVAIALVIWLAAR
jgi:carbon monoxide dehydrogenase subunit G